MKRMADKLNWGVKLLEMVNLGKAMVIWKKTEICGLIICVIFWKDPEDSFLFVINNVSLYSILPS